mgnify:FL=1|jgi:8-oxo-dGTP pyrophosphatase MutT (NUDIX family)
MKSNKNPWKTLSSAQIYESPWITLQVDDVINPAGKKSTYSITKFKKLAVGVLPIDQDGFTYIVGQWRYPFEKYTWEIPEGGGDFGVDPQISGARELKEETGIEANKWEKIVEMDMSNSATNEVAHIYLATELTFGAAHPDEDEEIELKKIHFDDFYKMVIDGEITDSLSVAAALKYKLMLNKLC